MRRVSIIGAGVVGTALGRYTVKVAVKKGTLKDKAARSIISLFDKYEKRLSV
jgi:predicted dinucleotide-binding enzyme